jgi:hypothetical protein
VKQPLEDELKKHCLKLFFLGKVVEIKDGEVILEDEMAKSMYCRMMSCLY